MRTKKTAFKALALMLLLGSMVLGSCSDIDDGGYVDPIKLTEKVNGQWQISSIVQVDEVNATELDLTDKLQFDSFGLTLDEAGAFTVTGSAPALLPTSGTWALDNNFVKSTGDAAVLLLTGADGVRQLTITSVPGATPELGFTLTRKQQGQAFVSYKYSLVSAYAAEPADNTEE